MQPVGRYKSGRHGDGPDRSRGTGQRLRRRRGHADRRAEQLGTLDFECEPGQYDPRHLWVRRRWAVQPVPVAGAPDAHNAARLSRDSGLRYQWLRGPGYFILQYQLQQADRHAQLQPGVAVRWLALLRARGSAPERPASLLAEP